LVDADDDDDNDYDDDDDADDDDDDDDSGSRAARHFGQRSFVMATRFLFSTIIVNIFDR
jgi:hypothetical protein